MLDLDFAFFNLINQDKRGLVYQKYFLDRLTPIFFSPRVKNLVELPDINCQGCNIVLPLGKGNLNMLDPEKQSEILSRSYSVTRGFQLSVMAVDRRLKEYFYKREEGILLVFGDNFIKAAAYVFIKEVLSRRDINKLVIVGEIEYLSEFIESVSEFDLPISIQNPDPSKYEVMTYRLLYEKGRAIINSQVNPRKWEKGNLVIIFDKQFDQVSVGIPDVLLYRFTNDSQGLASDLEMGLAKSGINPFLYSLAPIMETCLLSQAGFSIAGGEQDMLIQDEAVVFRKIIELGDNAGLWDILLDKVW